MDIVFALTVATIIGTALVGGTFYGFSSIVMPGLRDSGSAGDVAGAARAMQGVNRVAVRLPFMISFIGTALLAVAVGVVGVVGIGTGYGGWLLGGSLAYLLGCFGVTVAVNVPLNNQLAAVDADTPEGSSIWDDYLTRWTRWNSVRSIACLLALVGLLVALLTR